MHTIIGQMLEQYRADSLGEERNALKEVVQEVALCGLSRAGFFKSAAFYGGTALRIFYGLDRFSEDLDFSLTAPDPSFDLKAYFPILESEIRATGLNFTVEEKVKSAESNIRSAFLKDNTREHILSFSQGQDSSALHPYLRGENVGYQLHDAEPKAMETEPFLTRIDDLWCGFDNYVQLCHEVCTLENNLASCEYEQQSILFEYEIRGYREGLTLG